MSVENAKKPERMVAFFDAMAAGYEDHMRDAVFSDKEFAQFYQALSSPIDNTNDSLNILDLGCGTGLEIGPLLQRVPNAFISAVDVSENMIELLRKNHGEHMSHITLVTDSYLTMPFGAAAYDHVISAMTAHHLLRDTKRKLYAKIHAALKQGGKYVEGDSVVPEEMEGQFLAEFHRQVNSVPNAEHGHYHVDIPFSITAQIDKQTDSI